MCPYVVPVWLARPLAGLLRVPQLTAVKKTNSHNEDVKWREGYLLPTRAWKITCRHFNWVLQLSSSQKCFRQCTFKQINVFCQADDDWSIQTKCLLGTWARKISFRLNVSVVIRAKYFRRYTFMQINVYCHPDDKWNIQSKMKIEFFRHYQVEKAFWYKLFVNLVYT